MWGIKNLGNQFAIVEADKDDISIQYCFSGDCNRSGLYVVPSKVIEYNKNSNWIIAKSFNETYSYWIIDKKFFPEEYSNVPELIKSYIYGPLDSLAFYQQLKIRRIDLDLKKK
jgi:hypothetical protein